MAACPNKNSKEWKYLVAQSKGNIDLATMTWLYYGENYPNMKNITTLRKEMGIPSFSSVANLPKINLRIRKYNKRYGTSHSYTATQKGPYSVTLSINPNYLPVNLELQRQRDYNRSEDDKTFTESFQEVFNDDAIEEMLLSDEELARSTQQEDADRAGVEYDDRYMYQKQTNSNEGIIAAEKTIRDLATRMADRIGMRVKFESDRSKNYKGKIEENKAYVNLAYATLDTPIHEILGHPIIRAIKKNINLSQFPVTSGRLQGLYPEIYDFKASTEEEFDEKWDNAEKEAKDKYLKDNPDIARGLNKGTNKISPLYQNLLKELEYGRGKEVLDRIKRDYNIKGNYRFYQQLVDGMWTIINNDDTEKSFGSFGTKQMAEDSLPKSSLEEQQEEAIVELLGLMTAEKLDAVKDGKLISLLKRLLKEIKDFVRSLLSQREVEIDKLPDNMTLGDLSDLLAYSNSKLILPGNEVIYTTPDNQQFKTYSEASKHISDLTKNIKDVDLDNVSIRSKINNIKDIPKEFIIIRPFGDYFVKNDGGIWNMYELATDVLVTSNIPENTIISHYNSGDIINSFLEKNKEYEQSKEIIDEWKRVNNIQYNPEEIYSRGQEFSSVVGAYSSFDVNLMMQNLLQHIEDNEKAGGKFAISAFTKPVDKQIGHLEGGGGKIKFKIYPKSEDILWAANTDVFSGSVWDASEKVNKDKKSELLGVSYTKYPSSQHIDDVQPNLAAIVDNLSYHHNELGIVLTGNNFRLEYDEDIAYQTKKVINGINSILDQKYGKLVIPEINKEKGNKWVIEIIDPVTGYEIESFNTYEQAIAKYNVLKKYGVEASKPERALVGIQPTQTNSNLKESIESIMIHYGGDKNNASLLSIDLDKEIKTLNNLKEILNKKPDDWATNNAIKKTQIKIDELRETISKLGGKNEYTSQALINTKISKLKEVAKKYPRSLIRSEVKPISNDLTGDLYGDEELPFQKVPSKPQLASTSSEIPPIQELNNLLEGVLNKFGIKVDRIEDLKDKHGVDAVGLADMFKRMVYISQQKESAETLPEEAGHFLFEMLSDAFKTRIKNLLLKDDYYKTVLGAEFNAYNEYYEGNVNDLVTEAAGKLFRDSLIKNFADYTINPTTKSLLEKAWNYLKQLFNRLVSTQYTEELDVIFDKLGINVIKGELGEFDANNLIDNTPVKEGVDFVFEQNPELNKIGSKQLYSKYIDSIFPDSKVKDIVYHGANEPIEGDKFTVRPGATGNGIWFSGSKRYATQVLNRAPQPESLFGRKLRGLPTMYSVILNIKNPKHYKDASGAILAQSPERFLKGEIENYRLHGNEQYNKDIDDGALFHHPNSRKPESSDSAEQVVVFESEQIHILGSKQDIEGFKKFVESNSKVKPSLIVSELKTQEEVATSVKKSLGKRITHYRIRGKSARADNEIKTAEILQNLYEKAQFAEGNAKYVSIVAKELSKVQEAITKLKKLGDIKDGNKLRGVATTLRDAKTFYNSHALVLSDLKRTINEEIDDANRADLKEVNQATLVEIIKVEQMMERIIETYYQVGNRIMIPLFQPFFGDRNNLQVIEELNRSLPEKKKLSAINLETLFTTASRDISSMSMFLDSLAETNETTLQLLDLLVKKAKEDARLTTINEQQELLNLQKKLPGQNTSFMVNLDKNGNNTGEFVVEYEWSELSKQINDLKEKEAKELKDLTNKFKKGSDEYLKEAKVISKKYTKLREAVYKELAMPSGTAQNLVRDKRKELTAKAFDVWMYYNVQVSDTINTLTGEPFYTIPKNKSTKFAAIQADTNKAAYYRYVLGKKYDKDKFQPEKVRSHRLLPQIYESTIDRMKILSNKEDLKLLIEQGKEIFQFREDEVERGVKWELADAEGNEVKFIPIYYNKRLKDPRLVSKDITMSMSVYFGMANNFVEMTKVLDLVQLSADMIDNRSIIKRDVNGNILMESVKLLTEKIKNPLRSLNSEGSNISKRLEAFINMQMFGEQEFDQGKILWGKVDIAKFAGSVGMYTALNQLSVNIPAATSNIINGTLQQLLETAAKQFVSAKNLAFAEKAYWLNKDGIRSVINQIGANDEKGSKLALWIKFNNVLQDYTTDLREDKNRTWFGKLFNTSTMFFLQKGGEHYLQARMSLAIADTIRWNKSAGKFMFEKEFYAELKELESKMRSEVYESKNGSEASAITKRYKPQIDKLKEKLDTEWNKSTNYYDAHTVANNKLVLKPEFTDKGNITHNKFVNRQNSINNSLNGIYNDIDKNMAQQYWQGRLAFMFRKWMIPAFNRRFRGTYSGPNYNFEAGDWTEGYYSTFFRILYRDLKQGQFSYAKNWNQLTDMEKANYSRAVTEIAIFLVLLAGSLILTSLAGDADDEDAWFLNQAAFMTNRMYTEIGALVPGPSMFTQGMKLLQSPTAVTTTVEEMLKFMEFWKWNEELETGKYKGWTRFEKHAFRLLPISKPMHNFLNPEEAMKFYLQ